MGVHLDSIVLNDDLRRYVSATALHILYKANFGLDPLNVLWVLFLYINLQQDIWFLNKKIVSTGGSLNFTFNGLIDAMSYWNNYANINQEGMQCSGF